MVTRLQLDAGFSHCVDLIGHHGSLTFADNFEKISLGYGTHAFLPGIVTGLEMPHVDIRAQLAASSRQK